MSKKISRKGTAVKHKASESKLKPKGKSKIYFFGALKKEKIVDEPVYGWPYT
jgi:hypothetical protein